ncbi:MAG: hypothetical protein Q3M24_13085 [Candidatus Electrothrix aestuarii]|uniref:Uncharacterized protein n=1 Tax=Candidatus Electrothrix aestuarii TaxID=3062594 RepID=A0AAU8LQQ7_9BACT|nr:hypothetical protein [Candidatus Electrothrix aestuarii]
MKRIVMAVSLLLGCLSLSSAWAAVDLTLFEQDFLRVSHYLKDETH